VGACVSGDMEVPVATLLAAELMGVCMQQRCILLAREMAFTFHVSDTSRRKPRRRSVRKKTSALSIADRRRNDCCPLACVLDLNDRSSKRVPRTKVGVVVCLGWWQAMVDKIERLESDVEARDKV